MAGKRLRIIFSGISTLHPGPPKTARERPPEKASVLLAANDASGSVGGVEVDAHVPFVFVRKSLLANGGPAPSDVVEDRKLGTCHIYYIKNTRVTLDPAPSSALQYHIDENRELGERPGSDDVAPENDIRWLADLRDLVPDGAKFKSTTEREVAAVVELTGGRLQANFPCKSVQAMTFKNSKETIRGIKRVLASEFLIDMTYPEESSEVRLRFAPLREGEAISFDELVLAWPSSGRLLVRIGNDTRQEIKLAGSPKRCDSRDEKGEPRLIPQEDDFSLHYELLQLPPDFDRPLPNRSPHQTSGDGCKPAGG